MKITLENIGKRFIRNWVFRKVNYNFDSDNAYAITGHNGSGKSTLLKIISGIDSASEGSVAYFENDAVLSLEQAIPHFSFVSPYQELIEEFSFKEMLDFHFRLKNIAFNTQEIQEAVNLPDSALNKQIQFYSSGMKQRVKLAIAFYSNPAVIFLDEPTVNLDKAGEKIYLDLVEKNKKDKLILVCSNHESEYPFCDKIVSINDFHYSK